MEKTYIIQTRNDTASEWTRVNPILRQGEEGLENDTGRRKVGDGVTVWNTLPYHGDAMKILGKTLPDLPDESSLLYYKSGGNGQFVFDNVEVDGGELS